MLKTIIVDDEPLMIAHLKHALSTLENIEIIAAYDNAVKALDEITDINPDVIFLDIKMPEIDGLKFANLLLEKKINAEIVFVTAYDEYALEAFEVAAIDYLLKPVSHKRLQKTINRLKKKKDTSSYNQGVTIQSFGELIVTDKSGNMINWISSKSKELFAYLLTYYGKSINKEVIMETLWPEMEHGKALANLNTCIYRVRKAIANTEMKVDHQKGSYILNLKETDIDIHKFYQLTESIEDDEELAERLLETYRNGFLAQESYWWASDIQAQYLEILLTKVINISRQLLIKKQHSQPIKLLTTIIQLEPYSEEAWHLLIKAYEKKGDTMQAKVCKKQFKKMVEELSI